MPDSLLDPAADSPLANSMRLYLDRLLDESGARDRVVIQHEGDDDEEAVILTPRNEQACSRLVYRHHATGSKSVVSGEWDAELYGPEETAVRKGRFPARLTPVATCVSVVPGAPRRLRVRAKGSAHFRVPRTSYATVLPVANPGTSMEVVCRLTCRTVPASTI